MSDAATPEQRVHSFHAEATLLEGFLETPLRHFITPQGYAKLHERGGYLSQHAEKYRLEGVISFRSAYTQVAGNPDPKSGHGWTTLATSVIEGLNILDVVTADRVVAQISTEYPLVGYVPHVSFLGTRFENLRIAGHEVKITIDPDLFGSKPDGDAPYSNSRSFLERAAGLYERIRAMASTPAEILERYNQLPSVTDTSESVECSLVNQAEGLYPGRTFGHVIDVPNFGKIYLATVRLEQSDYQKGTGIPKCTEISLTMIEIKLGCVASGKIAVGNSKTNGGTKP